MSNQRNSFKCNDQGIAVHAITEENDKQLPKNSCKRNNEEITVDMIIKEGE